MIKNHFIIGAILMLNMLSCQTKLENIQPPADVIDKEAMIAILADIQLAEAAAAVHPLKFEEKSALISDYYAKVLAIHKVDTTLFRKSLQWYMRNPAVTDPMYDEVMERIQVKEKEILVKEPDKVESTVKADSVKNKAAPRLVPGRLIPGKGK